MKIRIEPGTAHGSARAPSSKSYAHRALICAALGGKACCVRNVGSGEDVRATIECIRALGCGAEERPDGVLVGERSSDADCVFCCRESASTMRFIIPAALALCGKAEIRGSERLLERGIGLYEELFKRKNISVEKTGSAITLSGKLSAGEYTLRGDVSSQYISGLLMALPALEGDSVVKVLPPVESRKYIDMTVLVMQKFGVTVCERGEGEFFIPGSQSFSAPEYKIEGDWSNAAFLYALNAAGGQVSVEGLNEESLQGDRSCLELFERIKRKETVDISQCPDLGPVLMSVCAIYGGGRITGTRRLRLKESDRVSAMLKELSKFGIEAQADENSVTVKASKLIRPNETISSHNDHRVIMALSVLAAVTGAELEGCEAVSKSWREYFEVLKGLGIKVSEIK